MSTEDDEKLARALQKQFEQQALSRSRQISSTRNLKSAERSPLGGMTSGGGGMISGSDDEGHGAGPRSPRRYVYSPTKPTGSEAAPRRRVTPINDMQSDDGGMTSGSDDEGYGAGPRRPRRYRPTTRPGTETAGVNPRNGMKSDSGGMTSGSDDEGYGADSQRPRRYRPAMPPGSETVTRRRVTPMNGKTNDNGGMSSGSDDEGFVDAARRLRRGRLTSSAVPQATRPQSSGSGPSISASKEATRRNEQYKHEVPAPDPVSKGKETLPDTSADAELARRLASEGSRRPQARSSHPAAAMERSSHHRPVPQPAAVQEATVPNTSADAELARRLASEGSRRPPARSSHPAAAMEQSSHHRPVPQPAAVQEATVPNTSADAELARRLASEGSRRPPARSSHPAAPMEQSSHHRPVPQPASVQEATVPNTSSDAELARRLASEGSRRPPARSSHPAAAMERSSHHRPVPPPAPVQEAPVPDTSADAELARRLASEGSRRPPARSSHPAAAMERSSHQRTAPQPAPVQEATVHDTSADAELARRLASEGSRRPQARSSHPAAAMERSSHHRPVPQPALVQGATVPDTSADAELARRLASEGSRRPLARSSDPAAAMDRSSHHRTVPQSAPVQEATVPDTSADAELARRLASEGSRRLHARSSHPAAAMERSSHHRSIPQPAPMQEATVPDTSPDAELARRLASEGSRRLHARSSHPAAAMERSSHHRSIPQPAPMQEATVPDTSADAELARRLASEGSRRLHARSSHPVAAMERSSHHRSIPQPAPMQAATVPDTSADAELARQLASEGSRRLHARSSHPAAAMERSSHHRPVPRPESVQYEIVPDTSADAELARRLASEGSRRPHARSSHPAAAMERSSHHRSCPLLEGAHFEALPDTSADAELARLLVQAEADKSGMNLTRGTVPGLAEAPDPRDDDTYGDEEIARCLEEAEFGRRQLHTSIDAPLPTVPSVDDDEALARKLEQELMDEEIALRMQGSNTNRRRRTSYLARKHATRREQGGGNARALTATVSEGHVPLGPVGSLAAYHSSSDGESGDDAIVRGTGPSRKRAPSRNRSNSSDSDGDLQRAGREQAYLHSTKRPREGSKPRSRDVSGIRIGIAKGSNRRGDADILDLHEFSDRDLALRLDQDLRDEALARELTAREARRISVYQVKNGTSSGRKTWTCRRIVTLVVPIIVVLAAVAGLVYTLSGNNGQPVSASSPTFQDQDPFNGVNTANANRWNNKGAGLQLEVLNALESQWDALFAVAVQNWDSGNPDALTLSVSKVSVDKDCSQVTGKLKVCNGDYGDTKWRGINQVIISNGFIVSSSARLNEFYLANADESQRQYTICHEIGHGFGLPHTDENFYNADLGNCMDYTSHPEVNKTPDDTNYAFLAELYGVVPNRRSLLRSNLEALPNEPPDLRFRIEDAMNELENGAILSSGRFNAKLLHSNEFAESLVIELGDGFQLQVNKLLSNTQRST